MPQQFEKRTTRRKRRWDWLLVWTLLVFGGGMAAGPVLTNRALSLIERLIPMLGLPFARLAEARKPVAPSLAPVPARNGAPAAVLSEENQPLRNEQPIRTHTPPKVAVIVPINASVNPRIIVSPLPALEHNPASFAGTANALDTQSLPAPKLAQARHKAEVRERPGAGASYPKARNVSLSSAGRLVPKKHDPFEQNTQAATENTGPIPWGDTKAGASAQVTFAKSGAKPGSAKADDPLDKLIAGVTSDHKGTRRVSEEIDAMLKEVQKGNPEPAPKRAPPPQLPSLSADDILKAMAVVKRRGSDCARRWGQTGIAELNITVGKDGRVTDVNLGGTLVGSSLAGCIVQAARSASFRPNSGLRFDYRVHAQ